jgi:hypothetical protein
MRKSTALMFLSALDFLGCDAGDPESGDGPSTFTQLDSL